MRHFASITTYNEAIFDQKEEKIGNSGYDSGKKPFNGYRPLKENN